MRLSMCIAILAAAGFALATAPADAAAKKKRWEMPRYSQPTRTATRLTVRKRSYLDAGTEVFPDSMSYRDYVFPPGYSAFNVLPSSAYHRDPLPGPFDFRSYHAP